MNARASLAAAMALIGLAGGSASAEPQSGGVKITGRVESNIAVAPSANIASGAGSRAVTSVGSIDPGVKIRGNLTTTVQTGAILNQAQGSAHEAVTSVGSIHPDTEVTGRRNVVISTGEIINMSTSRDTACVVVGSLGVVPGCEEESSR